LGENSINPDKFAPRFKSPFGLNNFSVNIIGLAKKQHEFSFKLDSRFFEQYGNQTVSSGDFDAKVILNKKETLIEAEFEIKGKADLICDRSLDPFQLPINIHRKVMFKYGDAAEEVSDEIVIITHEQDRLDVGQFMYEYIVLEVPIKKIHPRFQNENEEEEETEVSEDGTLVYRTDKEEEKIDPRWEQLKKLKQK
jgi:uncharacterized protein